MAVSRHIRRWPWLVGQPLRLGRSRSALAPAHHFQLHVQELAGAVHGRLGCSEAGERGAVSVGCKRTAGTGQAWRGRGAGSLTVIRPHLSPGPADRGARHHDGGGAAVVAHWQAQPGEGRQCWVPRLPRAAKQTLQRNTAQNSEARGAQGPRWLRSPGRNPNLGHCDHRAVLLRSAPSPTLHEGPEEMAVLRERGGVPRFNTARLWLVMAGPHPKPLETQEESWQI